MPPEPLTSALRETLALFGESGAPKSTTEVANHLDLGRRSAYERLERLVDRDELETKRIGANGRVWWLPTPERDLVERAFETSPVGLSVLSEDGPERMNARAAEIYGASTDDLFGDVAGEPAVFDAAGRPVPPEERPDSRVFRTGEPIDGWECRLEGADGRRRWLSVSAAPMHSTTGDVERVVVATEDVTHLRERSRKLLRQRETLRTELDEMLSRIDDAFFALDEAGRFTCLNDRAERLLRRDAADLVGRDVRDEFPESVGSAFQRECERAVETGEAATFEEFYPPLETWFEVRAYPSETGLSVYFRDVTERKRRERELEQYETIVETIEDGVYVLDGDYRFVQVNDAYARMTGYDRETLLGARCSLVGGEDVSREATDRSRAMADADEGAAVVEAEIHRADGDRLPAESKLTPLPKEDGAFGGTVGVVRDISERLERDRELESQRERSRALDTLNRVVRALSKAVIDQSTRTEIEQTVCEGLAASDAYLFAWAGGIDMESQTVFRRSGAGDDGYLDGRTISVDPAHPQGDGPVGRAVRTHEIQVTGEAFSDEAHVRWSEHAREWDARSAAVLPIVHDEVPYGVLAVYTDRSTAFTADERALLAYLGEIVGHAIAATEQRRALTSDEVLELKFRIPNVFDALDVRVTETGRITLDRSVPVGDGRYLEYGTATTDMLPVLDAFVEDLPYWRSVTLLEENAATDTTLFEVRLVDPPVVSAISALGGYVKQDVIEDGEYFTEIHLPPSADVRRVTDAIREAYPMARLATRRQVARETGSLLPFSRMLTEKLTECQRTALEAAYFAGYYEWPRHVTAQDLADSLGVSAPTFHQHLRTAHHKVFEMVLTDPGVT